MLPIACNRQVACVFCLCIQLILRLQVEVVNTHSRQTTGAFTYCCTAANQADDEEKGPDCYYYDGRNQSVHVFKEVVVVVICDEHVGSNVA